MMETIDERELQKNKKNKRKTRGARRKKVARGTEAISGRAKLFCCAFKLGFLQSICKASLILYSNLELALSIVSKQRELYESKHVAVECRCLKIRDFLSFLICFSILVLK